MDLKTTHKLIRQTRDAPRPMGFSTSSLALTIGLIVVALAGNSLATLYFWQPKTSSEPLLCLMIGILIAQPCLLAVWYALGSQKVIVRAPMTIGIMFLLLIGYVLTFACRDPGMPGEIPVFFLGIALGLFSITQFPLWIYRRATRQVISQRQINSEFRSSQFGIKHLLIATTIAAVLISLGQFTISFLEPEFATGAPIGQIIRFLVPYVVMVSLIAFLCTAFIFFGRRRLLVGVALLLIISISAILLSSQLVIGTVFGTFNFSQIARNVSLFLIGFSGTMVSVMIIYYSIGYRLRSDKVSS